MVEDDGRGEEAATRASELREILQENEKHDAIKTQSVRGRGLAHIVAPIMDELEFSDRPGGGLSIRVRKYFFPPKK